MKKNNRKCIVCSTVYTYCPNCQADSNKPAWMRIYHDENCKKIYATISNYLEKVITSAEAKEILDTCNLSNKKNFHHVIADAINTIYSEQKTVKKTNKKKTSETKITEVVENIEDVNKTEDSE